MSHTYEHIVVKVKCIIQLQKYLNHREEKIPQLKIMQLIILAQSPVQVLIHVLVDLEFTDCTYGPGFPAPFVAPEIVPLSIIVSKIHRNTVLFTII